MHVTVLAENRTSICAKYPLTSHVIASARIAETVPEFWAGEQGMSVRTLHRAVAKQQGLPQAETQNRRNFILLIPLSASLRVRQFIVTACWVDIMQACHSTDTVHNRFLVCNGSSDNISTALNDSSESDRNRCLCTTACAFAPSPE